MKNSGWYNESRRHSLASQGIKTGTKTTMPVLTKKSPIPPVKNIIATIRVKPKGNEDDDDYDEHYDEAMEYEYPDKEYFQLEEWLNKNVKDWELNGNAYSVETTKEKITEFKKLVEKVTKKKQEIEWDYWVDA